MFVAEKLFLNVMLLVSAVFYWYTSSHLIPAVLGIVFMLLYLVDTSFSFVSLGLAAFTIVMIIYFLFYDYVEYIPGSSVLHFGSSIIYMIVVAIKSNEIFESY